MTDAPIDQPWTPEELAAVPDTPRQVSIWRIAAGVAAGAIAAAIVVLPAATWWESFTKPDTAGLASNVATSMGNSLRSDDSYRQYGITIPSVTLVRTGDNTYTGQATVQPSNGSSHQVSVTVICDGDNMMWETQPGAFAWLTVG